MRREKANKVIRKGLSVSLATLMLVGTVNLSTLDVFATDYTTYSEVQTSATWSADKVRWTELSSDTVPTEITAVSGNSLTLGTHEFDSGLIHTRQGMGLDIRSDATGMFDGITTIDGDNYLTKSTISVADGANVGTSVLTLVSGAALSSAGRMSIVTLENEGTITNSSTGTLTIENYYEGTGSITNHGTIRLDGSGSIVNNGSITNESDGTMSIYSYSGTGTLNNVGDITFTASGRLQNGTNSGTITANRLTVKNGFSNTGSIHVDGTFTTASVLTLQGGSDATDFGHFVVDSNNVKISSEGGSFYLKVGSGTEKQISGAFTDVPVSSLLAEPTVEIGLKGVDDSEILSSGDEVPLFMILKGVQADPYVNVTYKPAGSSTAVRDASPTVTWQRRDGNSGEWRDWTPAQSGPNSLSYSATGSNSVAPDENPIYIRAILQPHATYYYTGTTATAKVGVAYLGNSSLRTVNDDGDYVTLSGTKGQNGWYWSDIKLAPASGYEISSSLAGQTAFANSVTLDQEALDNADIYFTLREAYTKGETGYWELSDLAPSVNFSSIMIDKEDPYVVSANLNYDTPFTLTDGTSVTGRIAEVKFEDEHLKTVEIDGQVYGEESFESRSVAGSYGYTTYYSITKKIEADPDKKEHTIIATDLSGRKTTIDFDLVYSKDDTTAAVSVPDVTYGSKIQPVIETTSDGKAKTTYLYKLKDADDDAFTDKEPTEVGEYTVRATVPATNRYNKVEATTTFSIVPAKPTFTASLSEAYIGAEYTPTLSGAPEGAEVSYLFKSADASDDAWSSDRPTTPGKYVVRANVSATKNYTAGSADAKFDLSYLTAPKVTYVVSATKGQNDYFTSDVYLVAPDGFSIADANDGKFVSRLLYSDTLKQIRLKRTEDGALTDVISLDEVFKVDKDAPTSGSAVDQLNRSVALKDGMRIYADQIHYVIEDADLASVTINNEVVEIKDNRAEILLDSDGAVKTFVIEAKDAAGNVYSMTITLMAGWMEKWIIPIGRKIPLEMGQSYNLEGGKWTVNGDSTVYRGGRHFFVRKNGEYTFTKAE